MGACILLISAIPMLGFPRAFQDAEKVRAQKNKLEDTVQEDDNLNNDLKSLWPSTKALLKNIPYMCICLANSCESLIIGGCVIYMPKFVETQFHVTSAMSAIYVGAIVIPGELKVFLFFYCFLHYVMRYIIIKL